MQKLAFGKPSPRSAGLPHGSTTGVNPAARLGVGDQSQDDLRKKKLVTDGRTNTWTDRRFGRNSYLDKNIWKNKCIWKNRCILKNKNILKNYSILKNKRILRNKEYFEKKAI